MTAELVAFYRARLDEDELTARAAAKRIGPRWGVGPVQIVTQDEIPAAEWEGDVIRGHLGIYGNEAEGDHIMCWHPKRVLEEVAAKRAIVDDYATTVRLRDEAAARISAAGDHPAAEDLDTWGRAQREAVVLAGSVRRLAAVYREHPDYRPEEFAPDA